MPSVAEQRIAQFLISVYYHRGRYTCDVMYVVGQADRITRALALRPDHEQQDLYNEVTEHLAWWIDEVATTVQADRTARTDGRT